jgi:thiol-disulfide isomerase/thioredoxin
MQVLKYSASWCQPCKALDTQLQRLFPLLDIQHIDIDSPEGRKAAILYGVRSVPTLILLDETGEEQNRLTGSKSDAKLREFFE